MRGRTVAILESRAGDQIADLVRKRGGIAFQAPALAEIPDVDHDALAATLRAFEAQPPALFVFQTGVGTRALFAATDTLGLTSGLLRLLERSCVAVRGPKPTGALRARGVRIDRAAAEPFTTREVLERIADVPVDGRSVAVQRYGDSNRDLADALTGRGARVVELATYRWGLPEDLAPLRALVDALHAGRIDLVAFTSASQVQNLFALAREGPGEDVLRADLARTQVASIGPVCSAMLVGRGVRVDVEASPPKLGPFIAAIEGALGNPP